MVMLFGRYNQVNVIKNDGLFVKLAGSRYLESQVSFMQGLAFWGRSYTPYCIPATLLGLLSVLRTSE